MESMSKEDQCKLEKSSTEQYRQEIPGIVEKLVLSCEDKDCFDHVSPEPLPSRESIIELVERARRILYPEEKKKRLLGRRSAFLKNSVTKGAVVALDDIEFRRPGHGIAPNQFESLIGLKYALNLDAGHLLSLTDLEE